MLRPWSGLPVRQRILMLVLAVWLPAAALLAWLLYTDQQNAYEAARDRVGLLSANTGDNMQRYLLHAGSMLARLAKRPLVRALDPQRCDPLIPEYIELNPAFATLVVRDLQTSMKGLMKLSLGSKKLYEQLDLDAYLEQYDDGKRGVGRLTELFASHPYVPKRVRALKAFADTALYRRAAGLGDGGISMEECDQQVHEIIKVVA